jgi:hypothetical protein
MLDTKQKKQQSATAAEIPATAALYELYRLF